ncbi:hypothetical protein QR665_07985 [Acinetobacter gerneri]|uniref:hypothetical protein n=1 Tax=Acinetobacter gerneri TaxID=202952 RepID=UPI0029357BEB|nr:hypothetical protein [Acinetobacter gerneri]MDV2439415.1 hypothetical protein [Acinetobacter gerneri]
MVQLINKGGFRERANRSRKYGHSENQQTVLNPNSYQPQQKKDDDQASPSKTSSNQAELENKTQD